MKRVGILTLKPSDNYGGILQAAALYHHLEKYAGEVVLIQKELYRPLWKRFASFILRRLPLQNFNGHRFFYLKSKANRPFIERYLPVRTKEVTTLDELRGEISRRDFSAVIVGSDQVWRWDYINDGYYSCFFLDFDLPSASKIKKISYAASFGKDHWQAPERESEVAELLSRFDAVSTREDSGVDICAQAFGRHDCQHVLDPTLLVERSFFDGMIEHVEPREPPGFLLTYMLDTAKEKDTLVKNFLDSQEEMIRHVDVKKLSNSFEAIDVFMWLRLFRDADFVVTDSFHGMVFSIIFEKDFWVVGNEARGLSRFASLLDQLGLRARLVTSNKEDIREAFKKKIDWSRVAWKLSQMRQASSHFLQVALRQN